MMNCLTKVLLSMVAIIFNRYNILPIDMETGRCRECVDTGVIFE